MDARNEFKGKFSPEGKCMKERIVPVISKVFSPSQFIHAQKKKSFYKALSGLSFHDSSTKDKRVSTKIEGAKCNPIYMTKSEGYKPKHTNSHEHENSRLQSKNKDEKYLRRTLSEKSLMNVNNSRKSSYDSLLVSDESKQRESLCSQRTRQKSASLIYDNLESDSRRLRTCIGGYDNIKRSFGSCDNIKKLNQKDPQHLPKNSNERPKNKSHSINQITVDSENTVNDLTSKQEYPVRPQRTRSISQSRRKGTIIAPEVVAFQRNIENNANLNVSDIQRSTMLAEKYEKNHFENLSELKDVEKDFRSRLRKMSEKNCEPELRSEEIHLISDISSSKDSISHKNSNNERILNEDGKRQGRYIKNNHSSMSNSQLASKNTLPDDMNRRVSLGSTENSNRIRAYSRQSSEETNTSHAGERRGRFRSKSVITPNREKNLPIDQSNQYINNQPLRPRRARSTSRSKPSIVSNIFNIPNQFKSDVLPKDNLNKHESKHADYNDSGLKENDSCNRARSKKKLENPRSSNDMHRRSKYLNDHNEQDHPQSGDEKDGGYYSLEKEESTTDITKLPYQLPPPAKITNPEYFQSDHSVDAIYISQVFMNLDKNNLHPQHMNTSGKNSFCDDYQTISHILGEDIYDNCQRSSSENDDSTINADDTKNYQIIQTVEETEIYEVPFDSKTPGGNEDLYATIELTNYEQVDNTNINQSLSIGNDSDEEGDYMDIKDFPAIKSETKVTVITIKDSDVEVTEKTLPSSNMPITTPTHGRHDGYFNPYVGKKLSQANSGEIYDNIIQPISHMNNSKYNSDYNSMSHSYPVSKAMIPKLPERNRFMSRSESMNKPIGQSRPNISNQNNANRYNAHNENNKKTSIDNQKSNGFEFISETNYKVDNLDYTFKLNFSQLPKGSSDMDFIPKGNSQTEFIPKGSTQTECIRKTSFRSITSKVSLSPQQVHTFGDLLQPLTFQDLLKDKHLNPPENEAVLDTHFCDTLRTNSLLYPESQSQKQLDSLDLNTLNSNKKLQSENSNKSFNDNLSVCWSEADSEFEFMNVTK